MLGMDVAIRPISYAEILQAPNAQELINGYAAECSLPEIGECCPQSDTYQMLEESGVLQAFGVYSAFGWMIGFAVVLVSILPHYSKRVASLESIYVDPEHRDHSVGKSLMLTVEQFADDMDCEAVLYSAPVGTRFDRYLSLCSDYRHSNNVYCRRLN